MNLITKLFVSTGLKRKQLPRVIVLTILLWLDLINLKVVVNVTKNFNLVFKMAI